MMTTDTLNAKPTEEEMERTLKIIEATRKLEQDKQNTIRLELELEREKRRADGAEDKGRKRLKTGSKEYVTKNSESLHLLTSYVQDQGFYKCYVEGNIKSFNIKNLLHDYNVVNEDMINVIKNHFDPLVSMKKIAEKPIQKIFNTFLIELFSGFNNSTSLKYLDTHNQRYLKGTVDDPKSKANAPDCSFIYKNVNINMADEHESLQDFVVCIGELKSTETSTIIDTEASVGQLCHYLTCILQVQQRRKVYGFIANIANIRFYYAEQDKNQSIVYYQSDKFELFNYLPKTTTSSSSVTRTDTSASSSVNQTNTSASTRCYNDETLKILIKFLTMDTNFYEYTTLNINTDDYLFDDLFYIKMRSGNGATSFVYLLEKNNKLADNPKCSIIKISKHDKYSKYFLNEVKILEKLKESSNRSNNFDSFFENIVSSSSAGKFIFFEKYLGKLESLTLIQSKQLINAIKYLHNCRIIHRDIRPNNIMYDYHNECIKLIDFGFATTFEITNALPIEGTISFGSLKFLKFCSENIINSLLDINYEYEQTFDLYCALNVISIMTDEDINEQFYAIKQKRLSTTDKISILDMYNFWSDLKMKNKDYSNLLELCDNLKGPNDFESIVNNLENFVI